MSSWRVAREQWVAWIEAAPSLAGRRPTAPLDELDAHLQARLGRSAFAAVDEEQTVSRPGLADASDSFESRRTLIRSSGHDLDDDLTRVRLEPGGLGHPVAPATEGRPTPGAGGGLEVGLHVPEAGLEISLHATHETTVVAPAPMAPVSGETVVAEVPVPNGHAYPDASSHASPVHEATPDVAPGLVPHDSSWPDEDAAAPVLLRSEAPAAEPDEDGLFIPTLTRVALEPEPVPMSDEPPPDELLPDALSSEAVPLEELSPEPEDAPLEELSPDDLSPDDPSPDDPSPDHPSPDDLPPVISGQTVIGPPPAPPEGYEPAPAISASSGFITSEPDESAQTLIRGEIPARHDQPMESEVPRKSKVVVDPSASGVMSAVYDEEEPEEAALADEEPDELDADDLVEEDEEAREVEAVPPPAPSRPPPTRDHDAGSRPPRPAIDIGPPPPPVPTASLDAALSALPSAPAVDEGWQVDVFGEHYGALVSPLRPNTAAAEVGFILHCTGLGAGATALDIGCGDGAHCVGLSARGLAVTGLDASPVQLMRASRAAQASGVAVELVSGDMRQPPIDGSFDVILCLGGTLGMFTDEDDRIALQHMRDRLVPGGRLMLHVLNRDYIVGRLPARSWWQGQGCLVLDEAQIFSPTSRVHVHRTVVFETGKQFEHNIGLRLYGLTELVQMCAQVGLRVLEYSGSRHTRGRFYGATSSEIWLLAQRYDG